MILTDTGPLVALLDKDDLHHIRCVATLAQLPPIAPTARNVGAAKRVIINSAQAVAMTPTPFIIALNVTMNRSFPPTGQKMKRSIVSIVVQN